MIHFGSCGTLGQHGATINSFLNHTGAVAVCGYTNEVDWLDSTAFELLLLGSLQEYSFTKRGLRAMETNLRDRVPGLAKALGFRIVLHP